MADATPGRRITVEVIHAEPARCWRVSLEVAAGTTLGEAVARSGLQVDLQTLGMGIHGHSCRVDRVLADGDRVELYRPLSISPQAARRLRAARAQGQPAGSAKPA